MNIYSCYKVRPQRTGFNMYAEYTQLQLTFLHYNLDTLIQAKWVQSLICLFTRSLIILDLNSIYDLITICMLCTLHPIHLHLTYINVCLAICLTVYVQDFRAHWNSEKEETSRGKNGQWEVNILSQLWYDCSYY